MAKIVSLSVALEGDVSEEGAKRLAAAIRLMRGVIDVKIGEIENIEYWSVKQDVQRQIFNDILEVIRRAEHVNS